MRQFSGEVAPRSPHTPRHLERLFGAPLAPIAPIFINSAFGAIERIRRKYSKSKMKSLQINTFSEYDIQHKDRQWFDLRPAREYRLRPIHASDFQNVGCGTHVIIQCISKYDRARVPVTLLGIPPALMQLLEQGSSPEHSLDSVLADMFEAAQAGRSLDLGRLLRAHIKRARSSKPLR